MITYKYSLIEDLKAHWKLVREIGWLKEHRIRIIWPNPLYILKYLFNPPTCDYQHKDDYTVYWVTAGNGGSYFPDENKIYVCPRPYSDEFVSNIVDHEIIHIQHEHEVQNMTHEEKEKYIESLHE